MAQTPRVKAIVHVRIPPLNLFDPGHNTNNKGRGFLFLVVYLLSGVQMFSGWMDGASVPLGSVNSRTFLSAPAIDSMPHTRADSGTGGGLGFPGT